MKTGAGWVLMLLAGPAASGCLRLPAPAPLAACAEPCGAVLEVIAPGSVRVGVKARGGTRLRNATLAPAGQPGCRSGLAVRALEIDERAYPEGPGTLAASSTILLHFPLSADQEQPELDLPAPLSIDLDLLDAGSRAGEATCLRLAVPAKQGWLSQGLSLHLAPREPAP